jgi:hypothetical protein
MRSITFLFAMVCLEACSPGMLVPLANDAPSAGNMALISEYDSVSVMAQNLEVKGGYLIFDVEINNRSEHPVEVIPKHVCYYASAGPFQAVDSVEDVHAASLFYQNNFNAKEWPMQPGEVEAYFEERIKVKQGIGFALILAGAGLVIHDAVQDAQDANKLEWTPSDAKKAMTRDVLTASGLVAIDITGEGLATAANKDGVEIQYLPDELLPQKTIAPGQSYRGKVFFRKKENYKYYRMIVPIGNTDHVFDFRQPTSEEKLSLNAQKE